MHINRIIIEGFKRFKRFELELNSDFNVIVGDNETGKSTILEAIRLVLTGQYNGRLIQYAIDPYLFNASGVTNFFSKKRNGEQAPPPKILIEAYLDTTEEGAPYSNLKGTNNTKSEDCAGLEMKIEVDKDHVEALKEYASDYSNPSMLPVEYYKATWRSFKGDGVNLRKLPFRTTTIDTSLGRSYRGPNNYLSQVASEVLSPNQQMALSLEYKKLRHRFSEEPGVKAINDHLEKQGNPATNKKLTVQMDMSSRSSWDSAITAHLDDIPFDFAGKGEQCRIQLRLAIAGADQSKVILVEEPENHLSHSNLNILLKEIKEDCKDQQVILSTHSGFVLNKLGIENLKLISRKGEPATLNGLSSDTGEYFMKLPGYDTLRLILSKTSILVEGPSDELVVQKAYQIKYGRLPIEDGVDVISVRSLAFKRFLEIAKLLNLDVRVVTDNDGNVEALKRKYEDYLEMEGSRIGIFYDLDEAYPTLEPQLLKANSLEVLNGILGKSFDEEKDLLDFMENNKTDCALKLIETENEWSAPNYIENAIERK